MRSFRLFKGEGKYILMANDFFFSSSTGHSTVSEIKVNSSAINSCHNSSRRSSCFSLSNKTLEEKKPSSA